jgi:hypothetical protein
MTKNYFSIEHLGSAYVAPSVEVADVAVEHGFEISGVNDPYTMDLEDYSKGTFNW